jgi:hypothetical protein
LRSRLTSSSSPITTPTIRAGAAGEHHVARRP